MRGTDNADAQRHRILAHVLLRPDERSVRTRLNGCLDDVGTDALPPADQRRLRRLIDECRRRVGRDVDRNRPLAPLVAVVAQDIAGVGESIGERRRRIASDRQCKFQPHGRGLPTRADHRVLPRAQESRLCADEPNRAAIHIRAEHHAARHLKRGVVNHRQAPAEHVVRAGEGRTPVEQQSAAVVVIQGAQIPARPVGQPHLAIEGTQTRARRLKRHAVQDQAQARPGEEQFIVHGQLRLCILRLLPSRTGKRDLGARRRQVEGSDARRRAQNDPRLRAGWEVDRRRRGLRIAARVPVRLTVAPVRRVSPVAVSRARPGVGRRVQRMARRHIRARLRRRRAAAGRRRCA